MPALNLFATPELCKKCIHYNSKEKTCMRAIVATSKTKVCQGCSARPEEVRNRGHLVSRGWALVKKVSGDVAHSSDNRCLSCIFHDRSTTYTGYTWYRTGSAYLRDINNHFYNSNTCTCNKYSRWECTCSVLRSADMKRQSSYLESKTIF